MEGESENNVSNKDSKPITWPYMNASSLTVSFLTKLATAGIIWGWGYLNYSIAWLIAPIAFSVWKAERKKDNELRTITAQASVLTKEKEFIVNRMNELPSWVYFPDFDRAEWLNRILYKVWPSMNQFVRQLCSRETQLSKEANTSGSRIKRIKMQWKIIVLCAIVGLAAAEKAIYSNYKVFRINPTTEAQLKNLKELENVYDGFSFWESPSIVNKQVDLMVAPHKLPEFYENMAQIGTPYQLHINDVQELIEETSPQRRSKTFDFTSYHTLDTIYKNLDDLAKEYPDKIQIVVGGKTYEGREIKGVKVSFKANNPGIFIEGGIHAREWISPATVMYILHQLLTSKDSDVRALAESHDWYIFPSFNPDGYTYTHTTNRLWRKTRKPYGLLCKGSDPNRNWDYRWKTGGASSNPCSETYAGSEPFSDIETKSMSEYIKSISDKFYAYISFHSYSQLLMFPYGHTTDHLENYEELYAIGTKAITALKQRYGTSYVTGNIAETIYIATGSTVDYIKGIYSKPIAYTYELRDQGRYGFLLPPEQILPTGEETLDSLVAMFKEAKARGHPKNVSMST